MDADTARLATSPTALALLDALPPYAASESLSRAEHLRAQGVAPELVSIVLTQARLRAAAEPKFGDFARGMLFTQEGLEQATRLTVAALHAQRYRDAGIARIADLTCGIGADAMAAATLGIGVIAFELDEATAHIADFNLRHWDHARVVHADAMATLAAGDVDVDAIFADPARRDARGRRHHIADYSPPLDDVFALRSRWPEVGLKVGPALPHEAVPAGVEAQWVSVDGDVVELGLWSGRLARRAGHSALVIARGRAYVFDADPVPGDVGTLGDYLYEPDGAVIRAGLVGPLADELGARLISPSIAYLTADADLASPFVRGFRVLANLPLKTKVIAGALRERGIGVVDIKKRGVDITPEALRPQLKLRGEESATVILTRIGDQRRALLAQPLAASAQAPRSN
jgi:hypothetical protein